MLTSITSLPLGQAVSPLQLLGVRLHTPVSFLQVLFVSKCLTSTKTVRLIRDEGWGKREIIIIIYTYRFTVSTKTTALRWAEIEEKSDSRENADRLYQRER